MPKKSSLEDLELSKSLSVPSVSRRGFLNYAGLSAAALLIATSCKNEMERLETVRRASLASPSFPLRKGEGGPALI